MQNQDGREGNLHSFIVDMINLDPEVNENLLGTLDLGNIIGYQLDVSRVVLGI